jgi:hypothetical protein
MKKILYLLTLPFVIFLDSCQVNKNLHYDYYIRTAEIGANSITQTPVVCDLNVDFTKRITASSRAHTGKDRAEKARDEAYFNALVNNNVDVIVSPIYQIEQTDKEATAIVYGFAGVYTNQRAKYKALEEVQSLDSSSFYKYELVWKNATIAPGNDYVLSSKGTTFCPNCPSGKMKFKKDDLSFSENNANVIYSEEKVVFNPYGPELKYPEKVQIREQKEVKSFVPEVQAKGKTRSGRSVLVTAAAMFFGLIIGIVLI